MTTGNIASPALSLVPGAATPQPKDPAKIHDAAQQFESLLIGELLKSSRGSGWLGTDDEDAGQTGIEMGEQQLARMLASAGGLGFSKIIEAGVKTDAAKVESNGAQ